MFELKERDGLARICTLYTKNGILETPALLPVINPNKILISPKELKEKFKTDSIITNAYIIWKNEAFKEKCLAQGIHAAIGFEGPIMTDSGTFQMYEYGDLGISPEEILDFQCQINTDIATMLDIISPLDAKYETAKSDALETIRRAERAVKRKKETLLACTVQGSIYTALREHCAKELSKLDCDIFAIGGVVPLMETYRFENLAEIIISAKQHLTPSKPVHLFGCGHPMIFSLAALLGCDLFDSSSYAKYAEDGRMLFPDGTRSFEQIVHSSCLCPVCEKFDELKELESSERVKKIAEHNLYVSFAEIRKVKQAIYENTLWELVEQRCRAHPTVFQALKSILKHKEFLERFENLYRKSFFYVSQESLERPAIHRYEKRLFERYEKPNAKILVILPEGKKPYSKTYSEIIEKFPNMHFVVDSVLGPVPIELDELYPVGQAVVPRDTNASAKARMELLLRRYIEHFDYPIAVVWESGENLEILKEPSEKALDFDFMRVKAVADMQFGKDARKALFNGRKIKLKKSQTGRIRNVFADNIHILSVRNDGFFTLKFEGGKLLHEFFSYPKLRVAVNDDSAEFVVQGKNVFSKFVTDCDENIRPYDEVLIVDSKDNLIGIGRALLTKMEMLSFKRGIAVRVR